MGHRFRRSLSLVSLVAISGCSDPFGPHGPAIAVSLDLQATAGGAFALRTDIDGRRVELTTDTAHDRHASTTVRGQRYGAVPVHIALFTAGGDSVTAVSFELELRQGYQHWVAALVGPQRPVGFCTGAIATAPLAIGSTDTLFVMYGSIPNGAVC